MGSFFGFDLPDWAKDVVDFGGNLLGSYNKSRTGDKYLDALRQSEDQAYLDTKNYNDAYAKYLAGASAASAANRAASSAAAGATERNRQAAAKKAQKILNKTYDETKSIYKPYKDTADTLLPQMSNTYQSGLGLYGLLNNLVQQPKAMNLLYGSKSAGAVAPQLPEYLKR